MFHFSPMPAPLHCRSRWQDVLNFVDTYLKAKAPLRKRLALQVVAANHEESDAEIMEEEERLGAQGALARVWIGEESIDDFKAGLSLFPRKVARWVEPGGARSAAALDPAPASL